MKRFKNCAAGIWIATAFAAMLTGCSSGQNTGKEPGAGAKAEIRDANADVVTNVKERGLSVTISQDFIDKGVELDHYNENTKGYRMITISYYSPTYKQLLDEVLDMEPEERTPELSDQYTQKMWAASRTLMEIAMVETEEYESLTAAGKVPEDFTYYAPAEVYGTNDAYTYIISIPELDNGNLNGQEQKDYQECKAYMPTVIENLSFIPVEPENDETAIGTFVSAFETEDLKGNTVTDDIFTQKKLTVVNVWGTFCGPCIEEMPELAKWSEEMPDHVQLIGLVGDIEGKEDTEHLELARRIVEKAGAGFTNLIVNEDFGDVLNGIVGYPTTFFVDQDGNIVGEPIVGADVERYKAFVEEYLDE